MDATHIVWDWNGTIFNDSRALIEATIEAFQSAGFPPITRELYQKHHIQPIPLFYERLMGRVLSESEQYILNQGFERAYKRQRDAIELTPGATEALRRWKDSGGQQSLLSMHPHERLLSLVRKAGIADFFNRIDGWVSGDPGRKTPHLKRHLDQLGVAVPGSVVLVGDSVDDARAAMECGIACILYHCEEYALHGRDHFDEFEIPVVTRLPDAVALVTERGSLPR